ncbi:MAG: ABC-F family ATP-binding cassette domain-containing protein [Phycisphaerae bacterium]
MSWIIAENLSKIYGTAIVLRDGQLRLAESQRVGLVGPNGSGKTTLLRMLAGLEEPTSGQLHRARGLGIGYLPQDPPEPGEQTLWDSMLAAVDEIRRLESQLDQIHHQLAEDGENDELLRRLGHVQHRFEVLGGYSYEDRLGMVLEGLGFTRAQYDQPLKQFSGGQRSRAMLAGILANSPDVLLLDEPTNHLDIDSVEWLEGFLARQEGAMVIVSHDRWFLDRVTETTWEVAEGRVSTFKGGYSAYVKQREHRYQEQMRTWQAQQEYIEKTEEFIRRNLAGQRTKEAQGRRSRLERFIANEAIEKPVRYEAVDLEFSPARRTGEMVLRLEGLTAGYQPDAPLVADVNLEVTRGQRIAIVGPNGSGKTTLLRTLMGRLDPLDGHLRWGANVQIGHLSQTHEDLHESETLVSAVYRADHSLNDEKIRTLLGAFSFTGDEAEKTVGQLSGGQRSRVALARLIVTESNVLLLDEPTNHLDLPTREALQEALTEFDGTILFVSHDRYLIEAVAQEVWAVHDGGIKRILGGWQSYAQWREQKAGQPEAAGPARQADPDKQNRKNEYEQARKAQRQREKIQRDHDRIEQKIHQTEEQLEKLTEQINRASQAGSTDEVEKLGHDYAAASRHLHELMQQWEQLAEKLEA